MKNFFKVLVILFTGHFYSCDSKSKEENLIPNIKRISIPISAEQLNSYIVYSPFNDGESNQFIGYNASRHSLDYFDLDKSQVLKSRNLDSDGPDGIGIIESIFYHNSDSIFAFERGKIHHLNEDGQKVNTLDLYEIFDGKNLGEPICNFYFKLHYSASDQLLYFFLLRHEASQVEKASLPLVASVNIKTLEVKALPIQHTKHFGEIEGRVGFITYLGFQDMLEDKLIYNFQYESTLFSMDTKANQQQESNNHEMDYIPELPYSEDPSAYDQHAIDNPHFLTPIPDRWRKLIYRGIWDVPDNSLPEGGFTEKEISISVFDEDLSLITEYSLPSYTYQINNWFANENGLYLNLAHPKNENLTEDFLIFDVYEFDLVDAK